MSSFYITTPIYYVNARPHLGHAYSTIMADAATRLHKMMGEKTLFLTGTDEHGDKIAQAAEKKGLSPQQFVDEISASFRDLWPRLAIGHDRFERTTDAAHKRAVQRFLQILHDQGDIYFGEFGGYYCFGCERFYTDKELENGLCPQHKCAPQYISEKNYFFRMSKYLPWLKDYLRQHADLVRPERYMVEAIGMLEGGGLEDLCISRPRSRLEWGIELPFDKNYVCYVWFDALIAYLSGIGWPDSSEFRQFWPGEHLIAKDILKPHAIFWPCMLKAANLPIYKHLDVHGYWLSRDAKMSKSLGNVVEPLAAIVDFGLDAFRYFLLREMKFGADANFNDDAVIARINADLANDLGNLFSRVLSMNGKYFAGLVPPMGGMADADEEIADIALASCQGWLQYFKAMRTSRALETLWKLVSALNHYVDAQTPWALYKAGQLERLGTVMNVLLAGLRKIAICLWPVMPGAALRMLEQLGCAFPGQGLPPVTNIDAEVSQFELLPQGASLASASALFPRIETKKEAACENGRLQAKPDKDDNINFDAFKAVRMGVGTIISAARHPDADRLLRLEIDFGEEKPRQIISGLAEHYRPEQLTGMQVCAVLNLAPRKIRGLMSHGMVLTVQSGDKLVLAVPSGPVKNGSNLA